MFSPTGQAVSCLGDITFELQLSTSIHKYSHNKLPPTLIFSAPIHTISYHQTTLLCQLKLPLPLPITSTSTKNHEYQVSLPPHPGIAPYSPTPISPANNNPPQSPYPNGKRNRIRHRARLQSLTDKGARGGERGHTARAAAVDFWRETDVSRPPLHRLIMETGMERKADVMGWGDTGQMIRWRQNII